METRNRTARPARVRLLSAGACVLVAVATWWSATPPTSAEQAVQQGCCEAIPLWTGALEAHAVFDEVGIEIISKDVPPGYGATNAEIPQYFLPLGETVRLGAVLGVDPFSVPSVGRYWWELECFAGGTDRSTEVQWTEQIPGGSGNPFDPILPAAEVFGDLDTGSCVEGYIWFHYDQGDPNFGMADLFEFDGAELNRETGELEIFAWVTPEQAEHIRQTGKYPITTELRMGVYVFNAYTYANRAKYLFGNTVQLARGTIRGSEAFLDFASNTGDILGFFFPRKAVAQVSDFQIIE